MLYITFFLVVVCCTSIMYTLRVWIRNHIIYAGNISMQYIMQFLHIFPILVFLLKEHKLVACLNHIFDCMNLFFKYYFSWFVDCFFFFCDSAMNSCLGIAWNRTPFCCTFERGVAVVLPLCVGVAGFGGALALLGVTDLDRDCDRRIRVGGVGISYQPGLCIFFFCYNYFFTDFFLLHRMVQFEKKRRDGFSSQPRSYLKFFFMNPDAFVERKTHFCKNIDAVVKTLFSLISVLKVIGTTDKVYIDGLVTLKNI